MIIPNNVIKVGHSDVSRILTPNYISNNYYNINNDYNSNSNSNSIVIVIVEL